MGKGQEELWQCLGLGSWPCSKESLRIVKCICPGHVCPLSLLQQAAKNQQSKMQPHTSQKVKISVLCDLDGIDKRGSIFKTLSGARFGLKYRQRLWRSAGDCRYLPTECIRRLGSAASSQHIQHYCASRAVPNIRVSRLTVFPLLSSYAGWSKPFQKRQ